VVGPTAWSSIAAPFGRGVVAPSDGHGPRTPLGAVGHRRFDHRPTASRARSPSQGHGAPSPAAALLANLRSGSNAQMASPSARSPADPTAASRSTSPFMTEHPAQHMTSVLPSASWHRRSAPRRARVKRLQRPMPEVSGLRLAGIGALECREVRRGMPGSAGRRLRCRSTVGQCVWASCRGTGSVRRAAPDPLRRRPVFVPVLVDNGRRPCHIGKRLGRLDLAPPTGRHDHAVSRPTWPMMHRIRGPVIRLGIVTAAWSRACSAWALSPDVAATVAAGLDHGGVSDTR
jgi:hypothetical protein